MIKKIGEYIKKYNMTKDVDTIIIGVSGGADSMCLLDVLNTLCGEKIAIKVIHINHGLRAAATFEAQYVKEYCDSISVEALVKNVDVISLAKEKGLSTEEAARILRYEAFEEYAAKYPNAKIAVAHNMNDQSETVLFNLFRGSSVSGICGIRPVRDNIIRPLLCVSREEIEEYLKERNIKYCTDESNLTDDYTRNRLRHNVIPYIEENINTAAVSNMFSLSENILELKEYLDDMTLLAYKECCREDDGIIIDEKKLSLFHAYIKKSVIYKAFGILSGSLKDVEKKHIVAIKELFSLQCGKSINLPYGITALKTYEGVKLLKKSDSDQKKEEQIYELPVNGSIKFGDYTINTRIISVKEADKSDIPKEKYTKWFDYDRIKGMLKVRTRQSGDYIITDKSGGRKSVKKYFTDEKVPADLRDQIPLICNGDEVIYIAGMRDSSGYFISETTENILEISVSK